MNTEKRIKDSNTVRMQLLSKIAWLYYMNNFTQAEIAERLGISRVSVNRLLKEAREAGVVEIKINTKLTASFSLAQQVTQLYRLRDTVCILPAEEGEDLQALLAQAAADVLSQRLHEDMTVGVGIGRTISHIPDFLNLPTQVPCRFVGLTGGLDLPIEGVSHSFNTITRLANLTGGSALYIPVPSYLTDAQVQQLLMEEKAVLSSLEIALGCEMALFSVGAADYSALLYQLNMLTSQDVEDLHVRQAAGDILGRFFDRSGQELDIAINQRIIGLHLDQLKAIPLKILIAGGENKREAIQIALRSGFCDILVTDTLTAEWLLMSGT